MTTLIELRWLIHFNYYGIKREEVINTTHCLPAIVSLMKQDLIKTIELSSLDLIAIQLTSKGIVLLRDVEAYINPPGVAE